MRDAQIDLSPFRVFLDKGDNLALKERRYSAPRLVGHLQTRVKIHRGCEAFRFECTHRV